MRSQDSAEPSFEETLFRQYQASHDRHVLGELFEHSAGWAFRVACRFLGDPTAAEDAVQTAFIDILEHVDQCRNLSAARAWMFQIVVNACRNQIRSEARRRQREESVVNTSSPIEMPADAGSAEMAQMALAEIKALPEKYRLPLWLHYMEHLSLPEVASALSIPLATAHTQVRRGLGMLRERLAFVGVATVSLSILTNSLSSARAEEAPPALVRRLHDLGAGQVNLPVSSRRFVPAATKSSIPVWLITSILVGISSIGIIIIGKIYQDKAVYVAEPPKIEIPFHVSFSFAKEDHHESFELFGTKSWNQKAGGIDTSSSKLVFACLKAKIPPRPILVSLRLRPLGVVLEHKDVMSHSAFWATETGVSSYSESKDTEIPALMPGELESRPILHYFWDRYYACVIGKRVISLKRWDQPYPGERLLLSFRNVLLESLDIREIRIEEIPADLRQAVDDPKKSGWITFTDPIQFDTPPHPSAASPETQR